MSGSTVVGSLEIQLYADVARVRQDMAAIKDVTTSSMREVQLAVEATQQVLGRLGVAATATAFAALIERTIEASSELHKMAERTGVSVESLSALRSVAKLSGTSMDDVAGGMQKLSKNMAEAQGGTGKAAEAFAALGVSVTDSKGKLKSADAVTLEVAKSLATFKEGAGLTAAMMAIFGKSGANLIPMLTELAEKGNLNGKVTGEQARQAYEFMQAQIRLKASIDSVTRTLAMELIPIITKTASLFGPALEVTGAYVVAMYGIPAAVAAGAAGINALAATMVEGAAAATGLWAALGASAGATAAAVSSLGVLRSAGLAAVSVFAGWEIGTWLRENFAEARLAGVAFVEGTLVGWERIKYAGKAMWLAMQDIMATVYEKSGEALGAAVGLVGEGLKRMGLDQASVAVLGFADSMRAGSKSSFDFNAELARLDKETDASIAGIRAVTDDMADEAIAYGKTEQAVKGKTREVKFGADAAAAARKEYQSFIDKLNDLVLQRAQELASSQKLTEADKLAIEARRKFTGASLDLALAKIEILRVDDQLIEQQRAATKLDEEAARANDAVFESIGRRTDQLREELTRELEANAAIGLSATELAGRTAASLRDQAAIADRKALLMDEVDWSGRSSRELREQAALLRARASAAEDGAIAKEAKAAADEWKKTTESIQNGLTDALFRAFESGTSLWDAFRTNLVNTAKALVLKPIIQFAVSPIAAGMGAVMSGLGLSTSAAASTGGAASSLGLLGGLGNFGSGLGAGFGSLFGEAGFGGAMDAAGIAFGAGNYGGALGTALGASAPYALGALALYSLANGVFKGGAGTPHTGSVVGINSAGANTLWGDPSQILNHYNEGTDSALRGAGGSSVGALNALATAFGGAANFGGIFKFAADGHDASIGSVNLSRGGTTLNDFGVYSGDYHHYAADGGEGFKSYLQDLASSTRQALDAVALPKWARDTFSKLGSSATLDDITKAVAQVTALQDSLQNLQSSIQPLGGVFDRVAGLSSDALMQLTQFAGGIDAFSKKVSGYVKNFYSDNEQAALTAAQVQKTLAAAGIDAGALSTKADYRNLVNGVDVSSEAGRRQLAALLDAADAFASISGLLAQSGSTLAGLAGSAPGDATLASLLTDQGNAASTPSSTDLLQTANDNLSAIAHSGASTVAQLEALVSVQSAGNQAIVERLGAMERALSDMARPGYLSDLAWSGAP